VDNDVQSAMRLRSWKPAAALRQFVSHFAVREASLGSAQIYHPLPARNDCFLEFYLEDPFHVVNVASRAIHQAPRMVLVGPHTKRREDLIHTGTLKVFHIGFTPVGFASIFQIPARSVANLAESAESVLGRSIHQLEEQLASTSVDCWPCIAEQFLLRRLIFSRPPAGLNLAAQIARSLLKHRGSRPVSELAHSHGRSVRQIERMFENHVGLSPKLFSRIARLQTAVQMSQREPLPDWSALALAAGYFDQSHMVRDFGDLTGTTPASFKRLQSGTLPADLADEMSHLSYRAPR
jgi:AraC-like DNA-binding protein